MNWLTRIFPRRKLYSDLSEEMREHLDEKTEQLMRRRRSEPQRGGTCCAPSLRQRDVYRGARPRSQAVAARRESAARSQLLGAAARERWITGKDCKGSH
jgi:hypothetical protein